MKLSRSESLTISDDVQRLVILSDIHGHLEPLRELDTVIEELKRDGAVQVVVLGDLFPGDVEPLGVLDWVMDKAGPHCAIGNHDLKVLTFTSDESHPCTEPGVGHLLTLRHREYLGNLPTCLELVWRGNTILALHGHELPNGDSLQVTDAIDEVVRKLGSLDCSLVVSGHTHYPFVYREGNVFCANTGSVSRILFGVSSRGGPVMSLETGEEYQGDKKVFSSYLLIEEAGGELKVDVGRFDYDREKAVRNICDARDPWFEINRKIILDGVAYW